MESEVMVPILETDKPFADQKVVRMFPECLA